MQYCTVQDEGRVRIVTLNRPEVMNALHADASDELAAVWDEFAARDDLWVGIVTGAGERAFSAGNDLKVQAAGKRRAFGPKGFAGLTHRFDLDKPLVAAVNGVAMGGGFEAALACDIIIAAENAIFALPEPRVGLIAGAGGIHRLTRQIPLKHAMGLLLTGRLIGAEEAHRLGFVNEVVPAAELMDAAQRWADEILECSPLLLRLTKESAQDGFGRSVDDALARDWEERIPRMLASHDHAEGPKAFVSKRKPNWTGR